MRRGVLALGVVALLAANVSWAQGKTETLKTRDGRTFTVTTPSDEKFIQMPAPTMVRKGSLASAKGNKVPFAVRACDVTALFCNDETFSGNGANPGGATNVAGNTITKLVADDLNLTAASTFGGFYWITTNSDTVDISCRVRVRMWYADGAGGAPGTFFSGFTFNAITFTAGSAIEYRTDVSTNALSFANSAIWFGFQFDDNTGATGATAANLDNMGIGICDPPTVGTSTDNLFLTTAAANMNGVANPAGATFNYGGSPVASLGIEVTELAPTPVKLQKFNVQ